MKTWLSLSTRLALPVLFAGASLAARLHAQILVTPKLGGGQVAADMVHIDIFYDAGANILHARVDDTYGTPELRALEPGYAFDPQAAYAILNGKAYNAQYGWNPGGFFTLPPGTAIWIRQLEASPELEIYEGFGRFANYAPIFGTAGSPTLWKWSGVMVHNTYAVTNPAVSRYYADYHIYFGDAQTGARDAFMQYDDATVRLEWTTLPTAEPPTLRFGVVAETNQAPLACLNAGTFAAAAEYVWFLSPTNNGVFAGTIPLLSLPATSAHGGPLPQHAALGACLELEITNLNGPAGARLGYIPADGALPAFTVTTGQTGATHRIRLSQNAGQPGTDPFGRLDGHHFTVDRPGLYECSFRVIDSSTNGPGGGPLHPPSDAYSIYLQAGLTAARIDATNDAATVTFAAGPGGAYSLDRAATLGPSATWQTVAGPVSGTNRLQRLTDPLPPPGTAFYRLEAAP